jgi:hypothetical protein
VSDGTFGLLLLGSAIGLVSAMWIAPWTDRRLGAVAMPVLASCFALPGSCRAGSTAPAFFFLALVGGALLGASGRDHDARVSELEARHARALGWNAAHGMFSVGYTVARVYGGVMRELGAARVVALAGVVLLVGLGARAADAGWSRMWCRHPEGGRGDYPLGRSFCAARCVLGLMTEAATEAWSASTSSGRSAGRRSRGRWARDAGDHHDGGGASAGRWLAERLREVQVVVMAGTVAALGAWIAAWAGAPWVAQIGFGLFGLGVSVIGPMGLALVGKMVAPHFRTEAISRAAVMGFSGFFFAPVLMGLVSQAWGLRWAFTLVGVLVALSIPLALVLARRPATAARAA